MVRNMKKYITIVVLMLGALDTMAQFGISGGTSILKGFGTPKPFVGIHIGGELPRDDQNSLYARISFYAKQKEEILGSTYVEAILPTTFPYNQTISYENSMNYTMIEGGNRYYIGNGYDSGFGGYGGANLLLAFNTVKRTYGDYDQVLYTLPSSEIAKGSIFNLGFGLGGGLKYTFAGIGTMYFDANFAYLITSTASNNTASTTSLYAPLLFTFNLGFRKDFF
ncbi:MAG: hypothetical protein RI883_1736 [Bacteroidota bacterium]|jgi:hypothetical protein